jgi:hypothetical protein
MNGIGAWLRAVLATMASAAFLLGLNPGTAGADGHVFKDPYNGGKRLAAGGGEPGKRYMALVDAAYTKDCAIMCRVALGVEKGEAFDQCVAKKDVCQAMTAFLTNPKSHKVLDGYLSGDEATLDVEFTWPEAPDSYVSVTMRQEQGKWEFYGMAASGSMDVNVGVSGSADLGTPAVEEAAPAKKR